MKCNPWVGGSIGRRGFPMLGTGKRGLSTYVKDIFRNGEQGFFYDPNDLTTMYQDAAGNVPVTSVGQPVGLWLDKSGRNNHAYQTVSASRPVLRQNAVTGANYLEFDGSDDFLRTNNIDFTATDKVSLFAGVRKLSDAAEGSIVELSAVYSANNGTFALSVSYPSNPRYVLGVRGFNTSAYGLDGFSAPNSAVISGKLDLKGSSLATAIKPRVNGKIPTVTALVNNPQGTANFSNYPLYIGRRGGASLPFNGHLYSLIGISRLTTDAETIALEKSIAKNTGVTLSV